MEREISRLQIRTFGTLSLSAGANRISDSDNRSKKVWLLLAYLLCRRDRAVPQTELIDRIWGDDQGNSNPENALKVTLHRARALLDKLWENAGHELILWQGNGYIWNSKISMDIDADRFEQLCVSEEPEKRVEGLRLYQGEFLGKLSSATWVIPVMTHYHNLYVHTLLRTAPELMGRGEYELVSQLCRKAVQMEPYHEQLHQILMEALLAQGNVREVSAVYEELRTRLFHDFGITPNEQTRQVYRRANRNADDKTMPIETVLEHLLEQDPAAGALLCEFDCFRILCHAESRAMIRSGSATHVALLSVSGEGEKQLTKRSLERAMENLGEQIRLSLRRGDAFSRCSPSQYVVLLPGANYENSCVVCRRVIGAFFRRYPHGAVRIGFKVQPLIMKNQSEKES